MEHIAATNPIPNSWNNDVTLFPESLKNLILWLGQVGPSMLPKRLRCHCLKWARPSRACWLACTLLAYVALMSECSMKHPAALCEEMHYQCQLQVAKTKPDECLGGTNVHDALGPSAVSSVRRLTVRPMGACWSNLLVWGKSQIRLRATNLPLRDCSSCRKMLWPGQHQIFYLVHCPEPPFKHVAAWERWGTLQVMPKQRRVTGIWQKKPFAMDWCGILDMVVHFISRRVAIESI